MAHIDFCETCEKQTLHDESGRCIDRFHGWLDSPIPEPKPICEVTPSPVVSEIPTGSRFEGVLVAFFIALTFLGGSAYLWYKMAPEVTWWMLESSPSPMECETYLQKYEESSHAEEVKDMLDEALWNEAQSQNSQFSYGRYCSRLPNGKHLVDAKVRSERLAWQAAERGENPQALSNYLTSFPRGQHRCEAALIIAERPEPYSIRADLRRVHPHRSHTLFLQLG